MILLTPPYLHAKLLTSEQYKPLIETSKRPQTLPEKEGRWLKAFPSVSRRKPLVSEPWNAGQPASIGLRVAPLTAG